MDTALVIMMFCQGDNHRFRSQVTELWLESPHNNYWTVEDMELAYVESGWKEENEK